MLASHPPAAHRETCGPEKYEKIWPYTVAIPSRVFPREGLCQPESNFRAAPTSCYWIAKIPNHWATRHTDTHQCCLAVERGESLTAG